MSNVKEGNKFEKEFCDKLSQFGFFALQIPKKSNGSQPADVQATRNMKSYLIDCKDCKSENFDLKRIEQNQKFAMLKWEACGNGTGWFAVQMSNEIYMIPYTSIKIMLTNRLKQIKLSEIKGKFQTLSDWQKGHGV